jgi:uncharacterized membrane protein
MATKNKSKSHFRCRIGWRTNLWLIPGLAVSSCLIIFALTQWVDHAQFNGTIQLPQWVDQGSASDCRDLVSATAGAIITTLGLILSITVLIFSMAASQFGQRLLRRFMRDHGIQISIGIFSATFVFSLLTLLSVTARPNEREFVPWVSAWTSLVLALSCVGTLIYFINHVAVLLQVNTVLAEIVADFQRVVLEQATSGDALSSVVPAPAREPDFSLLASSSGYLQWIDYPQLVGTARQSGCEVAFLHHAGRFILEGSPLAVGWVDPGQEKSSPKAVLVEAFEERVRLGPRRTMRQDPGFAVAQIVEIGLRAMSPAVNDPFTMLSCVDALSVCLRVFLVSPEHRPLHLDEQGTVRVREKLLTFARMAAGGFDPMRQVSRDSTAATIRIFQAIAALAPFIFDVSQLGELEFQVDLTREGYISNAVSRDREDVDREFSLVKEAVNAARRRLAAQSKTP